jgi:hypothetical protein
MSAGSAFRRQQRPEDLRVQAAAGGAIGMLDRIALRASSCRKRTYRGSTSSSCRRSGSSAAPGQPGMTASSTEAGTRLGTTDTSWTRWRASASSLDARPCTAFATEGGTAAFVLAASSSVT